MKKKGRPFGSTKIPNEEKSKNITTKVTELAWKWIKSKPKGWLGDWIEEEARKNKAV